MAEETVISTKIVSFEDENLAKCFSNASKYLSKVKSGPYQIKCTRDCGIYCLQLWFLEDILSPNYKSRTDKVLQARDLVNMIY